MDYEGRITRLQDLISEKPMDALLVTNLINVSYLCGFSGTNGQLLVTSSRAVFLSDPRYEARAATMVSGAEIDIYPSRLSDRLFPRLRDAGIKRLGVEGDTMTLAQHEDLRKRLDGVELESTSGIVELMRRTKEPEEVSLLKQAVQIGDRAFGWVLERLVPGVSEREIALELEIRMREWGAEEVSFAPIVGSGPLSAHIHHTPTNRELGKGDLVLLDFGCRFSGYCSDLTRTVVIGPATEEQQAIYELVLKAQAAGVAAVRPSCSGVDTDQAARRVIEAAGMGEHFGHGLGHGVGLEIHESPRLNKISEDVLEVGDVVTVEPGVYLQGVGGVRIEDCVLVTEEGCEVLGSAPKNEMIEL